METHSNNSYIYLGFGLGVLAVAVVAFLGTMLDVIRVTIV